MLQPGLERREEFTAAGRLLTDVGGTLAVKVLSTPSMIAVMERTCSLLAREHLPAGRATVGFEVCVRHVAGAGEGTRCVCRARLEEIVEARKLHFSVEVLALDGHGREGRTVGVGRHQRRVIDVTAHAAAVGA